MRYGEGFMLYGHRVSRRKSFSDPKPDAQKAG